MGRQDIIARLRENEAALRSRGVAHAALLGWRARGDARADSDTDIIIIIIKIGLRLDLVSTNMSDQRGMLPDCFMDLLRVVNRDSLKSYIGFAGTFDAAYSF